MQILSAVKFDSLEDKKSESLMELTLELSKNKIEFFDFESQRLVMYISDMRLKLFVESYAADKGYAIRYEANNNELIIQYQLLLLLIDEMEMLLSDFNLREALEETLKIEGSHNELKELFETKEKFSSYFFKTLQGALEKEFFLTLVKTFVNAAIAGAAGYLEQK